jgi:hypothetical protein
MARLPIRSGAKRVTERIERDWMQREQVMQRLATAACLREPHLSTPLPIGGEMFSAMAGAPEAEAPPDSLLPQLHRG